MGNTNWSEIGCNICISIDKGNPGHRINRMSILNWFHKRSCIVFQISGNMMGGRSINYAGMHLFILIYVYLCCLYIVSVEKH